MLCCDLRVQNDVQNHKTYTQQNSLNRNIARIEMFLNVEVVFTYILHAFDHEMFSPLLCCHLGVLLGAPWAIQILSEMQKIKQKSHLGEAWRPKSVLVRFKGSKTASEIAKISLNRSIACWENFFFMKLFLHTFHPGMFSPLLCCRLGVHFEVRFPHLGVLFGRFG